MSIDHESLDKKLVSFLSFLEENIQKEPTSKSKAEFNFHFLEIQNEFSNVEVKELGVLIEKLKKPLNNNKKLIEVYNKHFELFQAEQDKKKYKTVLN